MTCPSLFYVAFSRGTTLGDETRMNSAIYFTGPDITEERLINMTKTKTGQTTMQIQRRTKWIQLLEQNTHGTKLNSKEEKQIESWITTFKSSQNDLFDIINNNKTMKNV